MKDFIYMDEDYLNSYLSQINNGQILNQTVGNKDEQLISDERQGAKKELGVGVSGETGTGKLFGGVTASIGGHFQYTPSQKLSNISNSTVEETIVTKSLHDNAFTMLSEYVNKNDLISEEPKVGKYVEFETPLQITDFLLMEKIVSNRTMKKLIPNIKCSLFYQRNAIQSCKILVKE